LNSILPGLGANDEILILNDGSEDLTSREFDKFEEIDSRIKVLNLPHRGLVHALNTGLAIARNDLIARADVDDSYHPTRFQVQSNFLNENPQVSAVFSDYNILGDGYIELGAIESPLTPFLTWLSLINSQRTAHPSVMFRKLQVQEAGGYLAQDYPVEDLALWIRLARATQIASVSKKLLNYSIHSGSISAENQNMMQLKRRVLQLELTKNSHVYLAKNFITDFFELKKYPESSRRRLFSILDYMKFIFLRDGKKFIIARDLWVVLPLVITHFPILQFLKALAEKKRRKNFREGLK
jgi:glycosyltransferase involved in cell wall biosynthesis